MHDFTQPLPKTMLIIKIKWLTTIQNPIYNQNIGNIVSQTPTLGVNTSTTKKPKDAFYICKQMDGPLPNTIVMALNLFNHINN